MTTIFRASLDASYRCCLRAAGAFVRSSIATVGAEPGEVASSCIVGSRADTAESELFIAATLRLPEAAGEKLPEISHVQDVQPPMA